jgi:hypothetical protein
MATPHSDKAFKGDPEVGVLPDLECWQDAYDMCRRMELRIAALEDELNRESYKRIELTSLICEVAGCAVEPDIGLKCLDVQMGRDVWVKVLKVSHYPRPSANGSM